MLGGHFFLLHGHFYCYETFLNARTFPFFKTRRIPRALQRDLLIYFIV
jgi:hypothetical protein